MPQPASNDPVDPDRVGASERGLRRASTAIRWAIVAALAVALGLFYVLSASAESLTGKVIRVADGDTLTLRTAEPLDYTIRIAGIDAPEKGQAFGNRSKQHLTNLTLNKEAQADCYKIDQYKRKVCRVFVDGRDVGLEQVKFGAAWWYRRFAGEQQEAERRDYERAEAAAKAQRFGLWQDNDPVPPWEWRRSKQ
jgi:endonuclease YncB( thermonuclease family)